MLNKPIRNAFLALVFVGLVTPGPLFPLEASAEERDKIRDDVWTANEIVVTASRTGMRYMDVPADVTVIDEAKLAQPGNKNIQDGMSSTAGVKNSTRNENPTFSTMELRGFDGNLTSGTNVLILLDGIPQRRLSFGGPYLGALPYDAITRMELVKGPAASLYGRDALAGVLQLFSSPGSARLKAKTVATYEFVTGTEKAMLRATGPLGSGGSTFAVTGALMRTEGWQPGTESVKGDVYMRINLLPGDKDELTVIAGAHRGVEDVPSPVFIDNDGNRLYGMAREANLAVPGQNSLESTEYRAGLIWNHVFNENFKIKAVTAYWDGLTEWKVGRPGDRNKDAGNSLVYAMTDNRSMDEYNVFNEIETQLKYGSGNLLDGTLVAGASYEYQRYSLTQTKIGTIPGDIKKGIPVDLASPVYPDKSTWLYGAPEDSGTSERDHGVFLRNQTKFFGRFVALAGIRYDAYERRQKTNAGGIDTTLTLEDSAVSPGVGMAVHIVKDAWVIYGNWGRGFSPVFRAVNVDGVVTVDPERSESYEAGMKADLFDGGLKGTVCGYSIARKEIVERVLVDTMGPTYEYQNVGTWTVRGVEASLKIVPFAGLEISANFTFRDPEMTESIVDAQYEGNRIPLVADYMYGGGVRYELPLKFAIGCDGRHVTSSFADKGNTVTLPGYTLINAYATYIYSRLSVSVFVKNALDADYYTTAFSDVKYGSAFAGTPRTYGITAGAEF